MQMNHSQYLEDTKGFTDYLAQLITEDIKFEHSFHCRKRTSKGLITYTSLLDAFNDYYWPSKIGTSYADNKVLLDSHADNLHKSAGTSFEEAVKAVLKWGQVAICYKWVKKQLIANPDFDLKSNVKSAIGELEKNLPDTAKFKSGSEFRMCSGFTKVYALMADDFIIYDGRVGAALGFLATLYSDGNEVDGLYKFPYKPGKSKANRNPEITGTSGRFPKLASHNQHIHAEWNVKANWLLTEGLRKAGGHFAGAYGKEALRRLEAALFMLGYDFPDRANKKENNRNIKSNPLNPNKALKLITLGKGEKAVPFYVQVLEDEVHFYKEDKHDKPALRVSKDFLKLATRHFKDKGTVLAGLSADAPAKDGWGEWLKAQSPSYGAPHGSKILAFLHNQQCVDYEYRSGALVISVMKVYES